MNDPRSLLENLGLTETEAALYLAALGTPTTGVAELAKHTGIKRPTVYHALGTLAEKGLVAKRGTGSRQTFAACPPEQLHRLIAEEEEKLRKNETLLKQQLPALIERHRAAASEEISTVQYEGIDGIKMVVDIALFCRSLRWDIIAPNKNFFSEFDKAYASYYLSQRTLRGISSRSLWERGLPRRKLSTVELKERSPRYLPEVMHGRFQSVIILFDDKVAIISSLERLSAILIISKEIHGTFAAMFEGLWEHSEPAS
jgi:HTH-type transcriptional regulator, sugar sensing transcriptional regulator